ncbi:unnamed protein product [Toxocara canis]|uniref:Uncharacterized protein n=1 Tax=Toxocara canis TaxID=6265 RepID=A0A183UNC3_TOXCA|nr:unnamed protein product [Toxocara canis]
MAAFLDHSRNEHIPGDLGSDEQPGPHGQNAIGGQRPAGRKGAPASVGGPRKTGAQGISWSPNAARPQGPTGVPAKPGSRARMLLLTRLV